MSNDSEYRDSVNKTIIDNDSSLANSTAVNKETQQKIAEEEAKKNKTIEELKRLKALPPISYEKAQKIKLTGEAAIKAVEAIEGPLTPQQKRVVIEEGFVPRRYLETIKPNKPAVLTYGAGQTGKYIKVGGFKEAFTEHENELKELMPSYDSLPDYVSSELIQLMYRGDVKPKDKNAKSKILKWATHFNAGNYQEAAVELLRHNEYLGYKAAGFTAYGENGTKKHGVVRRLEEASAAISRFAKITNEEGWNGR